MSSSSEGVADARGLGINVVDGRSGPAAVALARSLVDARSTPPGISVLLATKDRLPTLRRVVEPLLSDPATTELIVVSDGSSDDTASWLHGCSSADPRVRPVILPESIGAMAARRRGLSLVSTEVTLCLDDDVLCEPGTVTAHARRHALDPGTDVLIGSMPVTPPTGRRGVALATLYAREYLNNCARWETDPSSLLRSFWAGHASIDTELLRSVEPPAELQHDAYHDDQALGILLERRGARAVFDPSICAVHLFERTVPQALRQWDRQGRDLVVLHRLFADELGPLDIDELTVGSLPAPLAGLLRACDREKVSGLVLPALLGLLRASEKVGLRGVERSTTQLARKIVLRRSMCATTVAMAR